MCVCVLWYNMPNRDLEHNWQLYAITNFFHIQLPMFVPNFDIHDNETRQSKHSNMQYWSK